MAGALGDAALLFVLAGPGIGMVRGINKVQLTKWLEIVRRKELASVPGSDAAGAGSTYRRETVACWSLTVVQLQADNRSLCILLEFYSQLLSGHGNNTSPIVMQR